MKPYWLQDYERDVKGHKLWLRVVSSVLKHLNLKKNTTEKTKVGNMTPEDPLEKARILEERIKDALSTIGMELEEGIAIRLDEDHNDTVSFRVRILPETLMTPDEVQVNEDFKNIIEGF